MIKLLLTGIWASIVSLGAVFGMIYLQQGEAGGKEANAVVLLEELRTKPVNVPVIDGGELQGYMVVQLAFTIDKNALNKLTIDPQTYIVDETFRTFYEGKKISFHDLRKHNLPEVAKVVGSGVNERLGVDLVQEVLFDQISYIPSESMRSKDK